MSEVIISRRGGGSGGSSSGSTMKTEYITFSQNWIVPSGVKNNEIYIRIFGSGSKGYNSEHGGGSGWMNNDVFTNLIPGDKIPITIGAANSSGETTSFGTYLSASGGGGGYGYTSGSGGSAGWGVMVFIWYSISIWW